MKAAQPFEQRRGDRLSRDTDKSVLLRVVQREVEVNGPLRFTQAWARFALELGRTVELAAFSELVKSLVQAGALVERPGVPESRLALPPRGAQTSAQPKQKAGSASPVAKRISPDASEKELMPSLEKWISEVHAPRFFPTARRSPGFRVVDTSTGGARSGTWSQPDFTVALLRSYEYSTLRHIELVGYELKRAGQGKVTAVHEALAHRRWVHYAYLVLFTPPESDEEVRITELTFECNRHGVGLITFSDATELSSFKIHAHPQFEGVPAHRVDEFVADRLGEVSEELRNWMAGV